MANADEKSRCRRNAGIRTLTSFTRTCGSLSYRPTVVTRTSFVVGPKDWSLWIFSATLARRSIRQENPFACRKTS
ncbi:hypothetical protein M3Y99_00295500 [Aphelenchoides fujianensis]|nr:hypothetical protein M3Y99_00295500 [Aphelenchoides fujianensis]